MLRFTYNDLWGKFCLCQCRLIQICFYKKNFRNLKKKEKRQHSRCLKALFILETFNIFSNYFRYQSFLIDFNFLVCCNEFNHLTNRTFCRLFCFCWVVFVVFFVFVFFIISVCDKVLNILKSRFTILFSGEERIKINCSSRYNLRKFIYRFKFKISLRP